MWTWSTPSSTWSSGTRPGGLAREVATTGNPVPLERPARNLLGNGVRRTVVTGGTRGTGAGGAPGPSVPGAACCGFSGWLN
ncbi:hypothetical protein Acsp05_44300 [Actinokineospora sp. NBRC 105648]|nr:hypothetical protein Acsp05_44300 [Actinokineospora sp. NBRC 105648]